MGLPRSVSALCFLFGLWITQSASALDVSNGVLVDEQSCTWENRERCVASEEEYRDPNLVPLTVDFGDRQDTVHVYVTPDVATFYNETPGSMRKAETNFRGQFTKFINLSPNPLRVFWISDSGTQRYIADLAPFGAAGTASYPNHKFVVTERNDPKAVLREWKVKEFTFLYMYDPFGSIEKAKAELKSGEYKLYKMQRDSLSFDRAYRHKTGRQWLGLYGRKHAPRFPMWPADFFGQTHQVVTNETHFVIEPPDDLAKEHMASIPDSKAFQLREQLKLYRSSDETMTLNMTVLSVAPRVLEIQNFLSKEEVAHILELATSVTLSQSTTRAGDAADATTNDSTRTSQNSWIARQRTAIIDSIYRRAADLLQIDEACFRNRRDPKELELVANSTGPITERLQLVHYGVGQQYSPHHVGNVTTFPVIYKMRSSLIGAGFIGFRNARFTGRAAVSFCNIIALFK